MNMSEIAVIVSEHVEILLKEGIDSGYLDIMRDRLQEQDIPDWEKLYDAFLYLFLNGRYPLESKWFQSGHRWYWVAEEKAVSFNTFPQRVKICLRCFQYDHPGSYSFNYFKVEHAFINLILGYYEE